MIAPRIILALFALSLAVLTWLTIEHLAGSDETMPVRVRTTSQPTLPSDAWVLFQVPLTTTTTHYHPPTTTTTAAPVVARSQPSPVPAFTGSIPDAIRAGFAHFGPAVAEQAVRVSSCETGGTFSPSSTGRAGERGLFQIHPRYHQDRIARLGFTWDRMYEVGPNIAVAASLYGDSRWRPWTCRYAA